MLRARTLAETATRVEVTTEDIKPVYSPGRPRKYPVGHKQIVVYLPPQLIELLQEAGKGNVSNGIMRMIRI